MKNIEPNLPCPVCGQSCLARVALRHAESQMPSVPNALGKSIQELRHWGDKGQTEAQAAMLRAAKERNQDLVRALVKVRSYNIDIDAGRINYRAKDHIQVIDEVLGVVGERQ